MPAVRARVVGDVHAGASGPKASACRKPDNGGSWPAIVAETHEVIYRRRDLAACRSQGDRPTSTDTLPPRLRLRQSTSSEVRP